MRVHPVRETTALAATSSGNGRRGWRFPMRGESDGRGSGLAVAPRRPTLRANLGGGVWWLSRQQLAKPERESAHGRSPVALVDARFGAKTHREGAASTPTSAPGAWQREMMRSIGQQFGCTVER